MTFKSVDGTEKGDSTPKGIRNSIQEGNLIIPAEIQVHIDVILKNPDNCVEYILSLEEGLRNKVLEVLQQVKKVLEG